MRFVGVEKKAETSFCRAFSHSFGSLIVHVGIGPMFLVCAEGVEKIGTLMYRFWPLFFRVKFEKSFFEEENKKSKKYSLHPSATSLTPASTAHRRIHKTNDLISCNGGYLFAGPSSGNASRCWFSTPTTLLMRPTTATACSLVPKRRHQQQ